MENRRERFVRVAENRTNKIIDMINLLGNCANKSNYEYTEEDIKTIFDAIEKEVKNTKSKFMQTRNKSKKFKLGGNE